MKSLLKIVIVAAIVLFVTLASMTACVLNGHDVHFGWFGNASSSKAERVDTRELNLQAGRTLSAATPYGGIRVNATEGGSGSMRATVHAFAPTQAEADDQLARTSIVLDETPTGVALRLVVKKSETDDNESRSSSSVDFDITVPAGVLLDLKSSSGDITADGAGFGGSRLESSYGSVRVENVTGGVVATSKSGQVTVANVKDGGVEARSGYGDITVKDVHGGTVALETSSGSIVLERTNAQRVSAESGYGTVTLRNVESEGELGASSKSGDVRASGVAATKLHLKSGYGRVELKEARGDMKLESSSGDISVDGVTGKLEAKTGYGSVRADGVFSNVAASSSSGDVSVTTREGSTLEGDWKITSKYGRVHLAAPSDARFALAAKTGYGAIDLGYSVQLEPGVVKSGKEIRGQVNGGGGTLRIESSSGDVSIQPLRK